VVWPSCGITVVRSPIPSTAALLSVASYSPDGRPGSQFTLSGPCGVTPDPASPGSFLFTDTGNYLLRYYNASSNIVSTFAGTAMVTGVTSSYAALPATSAVFSTARTVRPFGAGWLIADYAAYTVRIYWPNGTIQTLVGSNAGASGSIGDGGPGAVPWNCEKSHCSGATVRRVVQGP